MSALKHGSYFPCLFDFLFLSCCNFLVSLSFPPTVLRNGAWEIVHWEKVCTHYVSLMVIIYCAVVNWRNLSHTVHTHTCIHPLTPLVSSR